MKIGLDFHGVIEKYPDRFRQWSYDWMMAKHEVHIITGQPWREIQPEVKKLNISYSHSFSIVDYHLAKGTTMTQDSKGTWWMDDEVWNRSKGIYIKQKHIDIHFDDSHKYAPYIPDFCTVVLVPPRGFGKFVGLMFWM